MEKNLIPRLPLEGNIDLTYRCNNNCHHCWLWLSENSSEKRRELSFPDWRHIVDEARSQGCQSWMISGGEPMIHPDFTEIFDYLTSKAITYSLNTNGTLITPEIARLMKRKGSKMIALYGADRNVHDMITRNPGSFDEMMKGISLLKDFGVGFTVQVVPMKDNWHQLDKMTGLAKSLSSSYRIGASWLYYSSSGTAAKNKEIESQRLSPEQVVKLDPPNPGYDSKIELANCSLNLTKNDQTDDRIFAECISQRNSFHVDPYGKMTFCSFVKDPSLRYDLLKGDFKEAWDDFIPSLSDKVRGGKEYLNNCKSCEKSDDCSWCGVYSWLEHRRFSAPVKYLCDIAEVTGKYKKEWISSHRRYYDIAGVTIQIDSDLPFTENSFLPKFDLFKTDIPGEDIVQIRIHFEIPEISDKDMGEEVYRKPPWAIFRKKGSWIYRQISVDPEDKTLRRLVVFNKDHTTAEIYMDRPELFSEVSHHSLTMFPTDQILLSRIFADRRGLSLHSSGMIIHGAGLLFAGRSEAGKSTTVSLLKDEGEILCDENIVVRRWEEGFRIHGTWSHGDIPIVSNNEAPLKAVLFLEKSDENKIIPLTDKKEVTRRLLPRLMRPLITADWWEKSLATTEMLVDEVPAYIMKFDKTGNIRKVIRKFTDTL